jgi:DNA-binding response OmpR family regulator
MSSILIVDDEKDLVRRCRAELADDGHDVSAVPDADSALEWLSRNDADLVILDLEVPGRRGLDLLTDILQRRRHTRILVHTARPCYRDDFNSWGADAYVMKSGDSSPLRSAVAMLLRKAA